MEILLKLYPLYIPGLLITLVLYLLNKVLKYKYKLLEFIGSTFRYKIVVLILYVFTFYIFAHLSSGSTDTRYFGLSMLIVYIYLSHVPKELR